MLRPTILLAVAAWAKSVRSCLFCVFEPIHLGFEDARLLGLLEAKSLQVLLLSWILALVVFFVDSVKSNL